jgi:hypothetical protein
LNEFNEPNSLNSFNSWLIPFDGFEPEYNRGCLK